MQAAGSVCLKLETFTHHVRLFLAACFAPISCLSLPLVSPVPVSIPEISVVGHAILGRPVKILCQSHTGSLPITYTLVEDYNTVSSTTVSLATEEAIFTVPSASDSKNYMCEANNSQSNPQLSRTLKVAVTGKYLSFWIFTLLCYTTIHYNTLTKGNAIANSKLFQPFWSESTYHTL